MIAEGRFYVFLHVDTGAGGYRSVWRFFGVFINKHRVVFPKCAQQEDLPFTGP